MDIIYNLLDKAVTFYISNFEGIAWSVLHAIIIALSVLLIEVFIVGWSNSGLKRLITINTKGELTDLIYFFLYTSSFILLVTAILTAGVPFIFKKAFLSFGGFAFGLDMHPWLHLIMYLVLLDFIGYWQHRFMHRYLSFWEIHKFHHSATSFNTITVFREHPLDKGIGIVLSLIPAVILDVPTGDYFVFFTIYGMIGYFKHSQIKWKLGWFGKYVIQSPYDHWVHHSCNPVHYDKNFANNFAIWDHLFGTYYNGSDDRLILGIPKNEYNQDGIIKDTLRTQDNFFIKLLSK